MRRHFDPEIEAVLAVILVAVQMEQDSTNFDLAYAIAPPGLPKSLDRRRGIGQIARPIDDEPWPDAIGALISFVAHIGRAIVGKGGFKPFQVALLQKNRARHAIPVPAPAFVRPAQIEGKVDLRTLQQIVQRLFQYPAAVEPVVIDAKGIDPRLPRKLCLTAHHLGQAQVVKSQIQGKHGLGVPFEGRLRSHHIPPLGETLAPPAVIFLGGMELRQVESTDIARLSGRRGFVASSLQLGRLDDPVAESLAQRPHSPFKAMSHRPVDLAIFDVKIVGVQLQRLDHGDHVGFQPIHRPCRKAAIRPIQLDFHAAQNLPGYLVI